jgi:hypothetical protein
LATRYIMEPVADLASLLGPCHSRESYDLRFYIDTIKQI